MPRGRRRQAARLHARMITPFLTAESRLMQSGDDFGIWWWDRDVVAALLANRDRSGVPRLLPETLLQPPGQGWRIVRLGSGYEAQLWHAKGLRASAWRESRFNAASWQAFARIQRNAPPADREAPPAQTLPVSLTSEALRPSLSDMTPAQMAALAAGTVLAVVSSFSLYWAGQGLRLSRDAEKIQAEAAAVRAETPQQGAVQTLQADRQRLAAYRAEEERTNPVSAAGAAVGILALHDLVPSVVDAGDGELSLTLPYEAVSKADVLVSEFEESGYFHDVRPRTDRSGNALVFEMKIREAAPPLTTAGG